MFGAKTLTKPPELLEAIVPVKGPLVITIYRPPVGAVVEVSGPVAKINLFSAENASTVGATSSDRILEASPLPPMNCFASCFGKSSE